MDIDFDDNTREMYRRILQKVLDTHTEAEFFNKILDGYAVTIDARTGLLVYGKFQSANSEESNEQ